MRVGVSNTAEPVGLAQGVRDATAPGCITFPLPVTIPVKKPGRVLRTEGILLHPLGAGRVSEGRSEGASETSAKGCRIY
jgi:hypothetical protein